MQARTSVSLFLLSLIMGVAHASPTYHASYPEYRVTIVGPAGSQPAAINNAGAVVGVTYVSATGSYRSFVNYGKGPLDLGLLGGRSNYAVAINDKGEVLGNWITTAGLLRGYVYYRGSFRQLNPVPGRTTGYVDINNAGYIVAEATPAGPAGGNPRSYLRAPNGTWRDLGALPFENVATQAAALNNRNQVTGISGELIFPEIPYHAFIWSRGTIRDLGGLGYTPNYGLDINDRGQVAGYVSTETFREALAAIFSHGRVNLIDTRPPGNYRYSTAVGINNHGHVIGTSDFLGPYVYRGRRMESVNALIDPGSGWSISFPRAINDAGQIAAWGTRNGVTYTVRLDLSRPHALGAPIIEADEGEAATAP